MKIVISSIFRNSTSYLDRYFGQIATLAGVLKAQDHQVELVLAEGDSDDNTYQEILNTASDYNLAGQMTLLKVDHGGPAFGSIDHNTRWRNISKVCNAVLNMVPTCDRYIYVESDLIWDADMMLRLLGDIADGADAVAPMCFSSQNGNFYDTWGYRYCGEKFSPRFPYSKGIPYGALNFGDIRPVIDSAGSCLVMRGEVPQATRFTPPERCIVGWCEDMALHGFVLQLNPNEQVLHP